MRGSALIISGPSGVGKTKISRAIAEALGAFLSVSVTTRPSADSDIDGRDYQFVDQATFDDLRHADRFLETAHVFGYSYGTLRQPVEQALTEGKLAILEIDVEGAMEVKRQMPDCRAIFILPPNEGALRDRLQRRGRENEDEIMTRVSRAGREIARARSSSVYDCFVINDNLERATSEILRWIQYQIPLAGT